MLPQHQIVGFHHGYFTENERAHINAMIRACDTDIVLVGMGNPAQELWLANNLAATGARLGFAVGALFDFVSGHVPRAPAWMLSTRVEWAYRLVQEPSRLWRRYLIGIPLFILRILHQWSTRAEANQVVAACDEARPTSLPDSAAILSPTTAWRDGGGKIGVSGALPNASYVSVADGK
jgi:alpha-1,3-mannosyltransferase